MHKAIICTLPCCNNVLSISDMDSWQLTLSIYLSDLAPDWSVKPYFSHPESVSLTHKTFNQMWRNFEKIFVHETLPKYFLKHSIIWSFVVESTRSDESTWLTDWLKRSLKLAGLKSHQAKLIHCWLFYVSDLIPKWQRNVRGSCAHCTVQCAQRNDCAHLAS